MVILKKSFWQKMELNLRIWFKNPKECQKYLTKCVGDNYLNIIYKEGCIRSNSYILLMKNIKPFKPLIVIFVAEIAVGIGFGQLATFVLVQALQAKLFQKFQTTIFYTNKECFLV